MGTIELMDDGGLAVHLESDVDVAALAAAQRAVMDTDLQELSKGVTLRVDPDNVSNLVALRAADFRWSREALERALTELVPYALQHVSLHSSWSLKSNRRMMAQVQDMSRKARQAEPPAG